MAKPRIDRGSPGRAWWAAACAVMALGGSLLFGQAMPPSGLEEQVVDVQVEGNRAIKSEKVFQHIRTRKGRPFTMSLIEEDVRRLIRTGLFVDVKPWVQSVAAGKVVIFRVVERPTLREILYVGCGHGIKKTVLAKETKLKVGDAVDPFAIEEARKNIEEFYHKKGFSKARVTLLEGDKLTDTRAIFYINEGPKQKILHTEFIGNTLEGGDALLRSKIKSKPPFLYLFGGDLDRKQIEEDVERLTAYYRGLGYFRARIGWVPEYNESQDWVTLTFVVDEGPRYIVRDVSVIGNTRFTNEELLANLKLKSGQYFNQAKMTADTYGMKDKYGHIGYAFADVKADPRFLEEPGKLDLAYNIAEGDRYRIGDINTEIKGEYPHTRRSAVLNQLSMKPGELFDIRKVRDSELRLRASELFAVDPMTGDVPKIVYSPPGGEEGETTVAQRPQRSSTPGRSRGLTPQEPRNLPPGVPGGVGSSRFGYQPWPAQPPGSGTPGRLSEPSLLRQPETPLPDSQPAPTSVVRGQYTSEMAPTAPTDRPWQPLPTNPPPSGVGSYPPPGPAGGTAMLPPGPAATVNPPAEVLPAPGGPMLQPPAAQAPWLGGEPAPSQIRPSGTIFGLESPFHDIPPDDILTRELDLTARARETQTGRLMLGVGVNSDAGLVGSLVIDEQNFDWTRFPTSWEDIRNATAWRGAGQRFRIEAVPGTQVQRYMISFQDPYLLDSQNSLSLSGFYYNRLFREWSEQRVGGRVSLGRHLTHHLTGSLSFRGERINVYNPIVPPGIVPELDEVLGSNTLLGFGAQLAHDTRDSRFLATQGHLVEFSFEQVIGSFQYPRGDVDVRQYFLLHERPDGSGRHVLSLMARLGVTGDNTPIYDRYYAGGFSTLRGYQFRGVSPSKAGVLVGGDSELLASAEYMFPITADDMLRGVVFCDTGTVEPTINHWTEKYRVAPGFGLRILIPAMGPAPLAFDFAFPLASEPFDRKEVFSFFLGVLR